ncbi:sensor histidine kinase [Mycetocola manganoxydans]|uniref:Oxygen sensor histidine kinase NreB n=1 Tax=Mycetocola manganoxydans TaxID=699879 RepID=A0A3L6ZYT8_9MICO|nr:sensor histidine kinase [Mycetocola manganoxydans]RLP72890.1 sensor histidine kinase [Mycetocola manganoxydans]GHD45114.1 two-component sensor histidine kinase [Mycetocola manganoxydans]
MNHSALTPVFAGLRWSLHSLLIALIAVVLVRSVLTDAPNSAQIHALAATLLAVYLGGSLLAHLRPATIRSARWIPWLWVGALSGLWVCLMWLTPDAAFIVFPLFFLYLQLLPSRVALGAVAVSTALSIVAIGLHSEFVIGGVIGPMIGAGVAVAIGFGYRSLYREAEERQQLITELVDTRGELAAAERAAGVLAERERLAREIHDTVAQGLSSIQLLLHAAERLDGDRPGLEQLQLARQTAAESLVDTRRIIRELTPPALDDRTLPGALARLAGSATDTLRASGTPAAVNFQLEGAPAPLPMNVNATLLRIAQGAIANVVRHARATRADITLTYQSDSVSLDIVDDGIGFDPGAAPVGDTDDSFGLRAIRQRVDSLGGVLSVESVPGEGTAIAVTVPVRETAPVSSSLPGVRA